MKLERICPLTKTKNQFFFSPDIFSPVYTNEKILLESRKSFINIFKFIIILKLCNKSKENLITTKKSISRGRRQRLESLGHQATSLR
jgi:hypothetical protein